jgi:hypothetical protein
MFGTGCDPPAARSKSVYAKLCEVVLAAVMVPADAMASCTSLPVMRCRIGSRARGFDDRAREN